MQYYVAFALMCFSVVGAGAGCSSGRRTGGNGGQDGGNGNLDAFLSTPDMTKPVQPIVYDLAGLDNAGTVYVHTGQSLYTLDPVTYDIDKVGDFGVSTDAKDDMTDLAVLPDGRIYTISRTSLYEVNANTGKATLLMANVSTADGSNVAMTTLPDGTLLASDQKGEVRVIDPVTKKVTVLGTYGMGFDTAGDLVAVSDGTMYGIAKMGPGTRTDANSLMKVDTSTAKATLVGTIETVDGEGFTGVFGIAYQGGNVIAFTKDGQVIKIDPDTGRAELVRTHSGISFYGAGSNPLVSPIG